MADITPITREEFYLAKAGGQDVPIPSAVTREEYYLEKLTNDSVVVPTPVTRREKFLYFACGGEIDLPSEEKMTRLERLIAKAGGMDVSTPTAVTRLEKFWANVEGGGWKTITGVLPLTFTAKGGNAADWVIYGNDDVGENLFDIGTSTSDYEHSNIITEIDSHSLSINIVRYGGTWTYRNKKIPTTGEHTVSLNTDKKHSRIFIALRNQEDTDWLTNSDTLISGCVYNAAYHGWFKELGDADGNITTSVSIPNCLYWQLGIGYNSNNEYIGTSGTLSDIMLVSGSTPPDHYIPYQQGVGERTENKMPVPVNGVYSANRTTVTVTDGVYHIVQTEGSGSSSVYIDLPEFEVPDSGYINYLNSAAYANITVVLRYNGESLSDGYALTPINRAVAIGSDYAGKKVNQIQIYTTGNAAMDFTIAPMITDSNTYTSYIPYGYQIPISCEHTISDGISYNEDKLLYFDGSVVSQPPYQTTSDFIAVTQKEITISGTSPSSTNKLVRLCGYDENKTFLEKQDSSLYGATEYSFTFALGSQVKYIKYSLYKTDINIIAKESNDYTLYIGDSPLTEGETVSKTSTGVDIELFEGENVVSTTLYNKPTAEIKYK